jgi:hypothetical protein
MILEIYTGIAGFILFATALMAIEGEGPKEITDFYSWLFYGLLFPLPLLKAFIRFMYNIIKL